MLTQNKIKLIRSLDQKKYRTQHNCFVVEGEKMVIELLNSDHKVLEIFAIPDFKNQNAGLLKNQNTVDISPSDLNKISTLKTPNRALAIVEIPNQNSHSLPSNELILALDNIQDPGNLGTIIRTANWFGVKTIICSPDTVDAYNAKVIQATMGAIFRTQLFYTPLSEILKLAQQLKTPIFGTQLDGENLYKTALSPNGIIVLGNESKGISATIAELIDHKIRIPNFPEYSNEMESLNVGIANAIVLAEFRRRN